MYEFTVQFLCDAFLVLFTFERYNDPETQQSLSPKSIIIFWQFPPKGLTAASNRSCKRYVSNVIYAPSTPKFYESYF